MDINSNNERLVTMDITEQNAHEEIATDGFGEPELVQALRLTIDNLERNLEQSRATAREQAEQAEAERARTIEHYQDRLNNQRDRWQADVDEKVAKIDSILATDQGQAYADIENWKRQVERHEELTERYKERAMEALLDKQKALESVEGGPIHPEDPRVMHIWEKAHRIATAGGFCSEFDRISNALGIPEIEIDYTGYVTVSYSGTVSLPISGRATREAIADGDVVHGEIDSGDIVDNIDRYELNWEIEEIEVETTES